MSVRVVAGILVGLLATVAAWAGDDAAAKAEQKKLEGRWLLKSEVKDGENRPDDYVKSIKLAFAGDGAWEVKKDGDVLFKGTGKVDATKNPKQLDLTLTIPDENKGLVVQGIYEVKGNSLRICWTANGERPTEFEAKEGSGRTYAVFQKAKGK